MTTQASIQLNLQLDSGSIFYQDKHDNITFHIEALRSTTTTTTTTPSSSKMPTSSTSSSSSSGQASTPMTSDSEHEHRPAPTRRGPGADHDDEEEADAETDVIKSFLRQHLLRNGEASRALVPLMRRDGIEAMLVATVALHLRRDGRAQGGGRDDGAAVRSLYRTLGVLVSLLQQRGKVLEYLEGNPHVGSSAEDGLGED
ncbi:hypothetical protein KVR01_013013 [Diaporthe batatas]|uniref:uncharacterized protein n=1 Tax=Diaporthe batatas TaxID=748121 RepID=UPI001D047D52|nr:uncharacterized protein KVR01_013013 [Diaporthe batatas]KAG8157023.1 hypothetical protein KVR01_013013 [Diaporthe batatas]